MKSILKAVLPQKAINYIRKLRKQRQRARVKAQPVLTEPVFRRILSDDLGLGKGDVVFIHSALGQLNVAFPKEHILDLLSELVGEEGTLAFPTFPKLSSYEFLLSGAVFNVRRSPSYTGILTEWARQKRATVRSLHPTRAVCAIGPLADKLTKDHQESPYPFDRCSPYYKLIEVGAKILGIGVATSRLTFTHCVDDALGDNFPVDVYHEQLFSAPCINYAGDEVIVKTYAHNVNKMKHDVPAFMRHNIAREVCEDLTMYGAPFFRAGAPALFERMMDLAHDRITMYPRSVYKREAR